MRGEGRGRGGKVCVAEELGVCECVRVVHVGACVHATFH